jgi:hypothetical protein
MTVVRTFEVVFFKELIYRHHHHYHHRNLRKLGHVSSVSLSSRISSSLHSNCEGTKFRHFIGLYVESFFGICLHSFPIRDVSIAIFILEFYYLD